MTDTPDWATAVPALAGVHISPETTAFQRPAIVSIFEQAGSLIEGFLKPVVTALTGIFNPLVSAFDQLVSWGTTVANAIATVVGNVYNALADGVHTIGDWLNGLFNAFTGGSSTTATVTQVTTAASTVAGIASTASTNATTALTTANATAALVRSGTGTPQSVVSAPVGTLFLRTDGSTSTTLYVKETGGSGNTGWVAK